MGYNIYKPISPEISKIVEYYWTIEGKSNGKDCTLVTPEACFDLIFSFADSTNWLSNEEAAVKIKSSFFTGIRKNHYSIFPEGDVKYFAVRFRPDQFYKLVNIPISEFTGRIIELDDLNILSILDLESKLTYAENNFARITMFEDFLLNHLQETQPDENALIHECTRIINLQRGTVSISSLCDNLGVYPKMLEREFKKSIGITPKYFCRLTRFNRIVEDLPGILQHRDWSSIALQYGYFDQAHFIREFSSFTGMTPGKYSQLYGEIKPAA